MRLDKEATGESNMVDCEGSVDAEQKVKVWVAPFVCMQRMEEVRNEMGDEIRKHDKLAWTNVCSPCMHETGIAPFLGASKEERRESRGTHRPMSEVAV